MISARTHELLRHLHQLAVEPWAANEADQELVERFARRRDEAAFAALVRRHGPLVWGVCRRVLHNHHDAEDAFQATFLVLARKAASVGRSASLGGWLHRVAYHTALKVRKQSANRR